MALSDFFNNATVSTRPDAGALTAQKLIAASSITVDTTAGWPVSPDSVHFIIYQVDAGGNKVAGTQTDWKGTVTSSTAIGSLTLKAGTDQIYPVGSKVIATPTGAWADDMVTGLLVAHEQDGTLKAGAVDVTAVIADGIVTRAKLATAVTTELNDGWTIPTQTVSSVTNNGNRSYDVVFNSTVASVLSPGMRLRTTRTVTAPTQCADLEASSSQYFSKTSPSGISFTDDFTCMAWVKLESYAVGGIIARRNADTEGWNMSVTASGQPYIQGLRIAGNNVVALAYQSLPLNKWVHIAASMDLSGTSSLIYIDGVLVPSATTVTGTCTALVQGTTALVVGASKSAGTEPFDGKIAQAAVFSSVLSASTIRSYMSQTLSGAESTCVACFTLNNSLVDTSSNANTVTASGGALATNADSPFGQDSNGVTAGTTDYALVMKVSTTTATVQVPEGCTIPTSGGVSAVAYSTATSPFGFTLDVNRWRVSQLWRAQTTTASNATYAAYTGMQLVVPVGSWRGVGWTGGLYSITTTQVNWALSDVSQTGLTTTTCDNTLSVATASPSAAIYTIHATVEKPASHSSAATYTMYTIGATTSAGILGSQTKCEIYAIPAGI